MKETIVNFTKPGTLLPNGTTVIAARQRGRDLIVLALTNGLTVCPYATWNLRPEDGFTFAGDYCFTFEGALRSFAARSGLAVETLTDGTVPAEAMALDVTPA